MGLNIQSALNSRFALGTALVVGRALPPSAGRLLAGIAARSIAARRDSAIVRAVRSNQWVVSGEKMSASELDQAVLNTFQHSALCLYNLYHNLNDVPALMKLVEFGPSAERLIERSQLAEEPVVVVGAHVSNFDFIIRATALSGLNILALAMSESPETKSYAWQNEMRRSVGFEILPASMTALRTATKRLEQGGSVITGLDRPLPESKYHPEFFGRPAALPVMHVHLALRAQAPVAVVAGIMDSDGIYRINVSDFVEMQHYPDRRTEIVRNAESVLRVAESYIREAPQQWLMFYPVWPEAMEKMP